MIRRPSRNPGGSALAGLLAILGAGLAAALASGPAVAPARAAAAAPAAAPADTAVADSALAVYDGGVVYPHDFSAGWWMLSPPDRPPGDALASRKTFLHSVVERQLLAAEAHKRPLVLTPAESLAIENTRNQLTQNALFDDLTKDLKPPTDADVERYRRQKNELAEVRFVTFADWQRARSWKSKLTFGTPFSALDAAMAREGKALATADSFRFVAAEQIPDTLADIIWSMHPGQVSDIQSYAGEPTILMLRAFQKRPVPVTVGENMAVKTELQGRQYARVRERYRAELAEKTGRTFDDAALQLLLQAHLKLRPRSDVDSLTGQPVIRANLPLPYVAAADTARVLARAGATVVTIAAYMRFWGQVPAFARPEIREIGSLEGAVDRIALGPALLAAARAGGFDREPSIQREVDNMREGYAVNHFYNDMFQSKVVVTEAALRKLWSADPAHYNDRGSVSPRLIVVDRESLADSLKARLAAGATFGDLVKDYSVDGATAAKGGAAGTVYEGTQDNAELESGMFATPVGQIGGPVRTPQGWVLWRIDAAEPAVKRSFAEARWMVERDFKILEADRLLTAYLGDLEKRKHVRVFEDRVTPTLGRGGPWD